MNRDMDLVRRILLEVEAEEWSHGRQQFAVDGYDNQTVAYHLIIMDEAGLLIALDNSDFSEIRAIPMRLTWAGHEFIESVRDDTMWRNVKTQTEKAGGLVFEVMKTVAGALMLRQLGL